MTPTMPQEKEIYTQKQKKNVYSTTFPLIFYLTFFNKQPPPPPHEHPQKGNYNTEGHSPEQYDREPSELIQ